MQAIPHIDPLRRLGHEAGLVRRWFPDFRWFTHEGTVFVEGPLRTNSNTTYGVRVRVPGDYPATMPRAFIIHPVPLLDRHGRPIIEYGASSTMHTLEPAGPYVSVCHLHPRNWSPHQTLFKVILKCRIWLEAYERHIETGLTLDDLLKHQEPRP